MKILKAKKVSYSAEEEGQEYFQALFTGGEESVLLQRVFEMPNGEEIYLECKDREDSGHSVIEKAKLRRDRMEIELPGLGGASWEIRYEIGEARYAEMVGNLRAIFSSSNRMEIEG